MSNINLNTSEQEGTVPVPDAMKMIENWKTYLTSSKQQFNVESYYVPIASFQELIKTNPTAEAVKVCIGLSDATDPSTSQILLIPIVDGKIKPYIGPDGGLGGPDPTDSNIYDLSQPEPPYHTEPPKSK